MLITFEGVNGAGKTTAMNIISDKLKKEYPKHTVDSHFCPGDGIPKLRPIFKDPKANYSGLAYLFMACADQVELMKKHVIPTSTSDIVLVDRLFDSTYAYQTVYGGLSEEVIGMVSSLSTCNIRPNLTLLFDIPYEVSMQRREREGWEDKFEIDFVAKFDALRAKFLEIVNLDPARVKLIDATKPLDKVVSKCMKYIKAVL